MQNLFCRRTDNREYKNSDSFLRYWRGCSHSAIQLILFKVNVFSIRASFAAKQRVKLLPPANKVWGKVMLLHMCVILFTGGVSV